MKIKWSSFSFFFLSGKKKRIVRKVRERENPFSQHLDRFFLGRAE